MGNELATLLSHVGVIAICGAIGALFFRSDFRPGWFFAALALYVLYDVLLTRVLFLLPHMPEAANWNWLGKCLSFAGMLAIATLPMFGWRKVGLTFSQRSNFRTPLLVVISVTVLFTGLELVGSSGPDDLETIAFQWTMPSFDEELFYRGVLLLMMNEAFVRRVNIAGAPIGYGGLLTSVLFGLAHALSYSAGTYEFDPAIFLVTGVPSLILLWLRERTGSLLLPVLAHSVSNGVGTLI